MKNNNNKAAQREVCRGIVADQYGLVVSASVSSLGAKAVNAVLAYARSCMVLSKFALADIVHFAVRYKMAQGSSEAESIADIAGHFSSDKTYVVELDSVTKVQRLYKVAHMFPNDKAYRSLDLPFSCYVQLAVDRSCRSDEKRKYMESLVSSLMKRTSTGFKNVTSETVREWLHTHSKSVRERNNVECEFHSLRLLSSSADKLRVRHLAVLDDDKLRELVDVAGILVDMVQSCSKRAVASVKVRSSIGGKKSKTSKVK